MKERFIMFFISMIMIVGLLAVLLISEKHVQTAVQSERAANYAFLGPSAQISENRALRWYQGIFVKTNVTQFTFDVAKIKRVPRDARNAKAAATGEQLAGWWQQRMRVLWSLVYQFMVRISNNLIWVPMTFLIVLPTVVDAFMVRKVKSTNFSMASPHMQLFGTRAMLLIVIGYLLLQMLPMMLHPVWAPLTIAVFAGSTWIGITQFAKRA